MPFLLAGNSSPAARGCASWLRRYLVEWLKRRTDLQANIVDVDFR